MEDETKDGKPPKDQTKRYEKLGFKPQKELYVNKYLPYAEKIDDESLIGFEEIKINMAKCIGMREINPGAGIFASKLLSYIKLYDLKFSKEDHLKLIHLMLELIAIPNLEPSKVNKFCVVLSKLLRKTEWLSPEELQVDWRPLFNLSKLILDKNCSKGDLYRFFPMKNDEKGTQPTQMYGFLAQIAAQYGVSVPTMSDENTNLVPNLQFVIHQCSEYFPKTATQEILDEYMPHLQPLDTGKSCVTFELLSLFLNPRLGYELWFSDFMNLWDTYHNPPWSADMMNIMAQLASQNIGEIDWEPYIPVMFSRILRGVDLPVSYKSMKSSKNQCMWSTDVSRWIVSVLGPKSSAQKYLDNFMGTIESYLHPANIGKWVGQLNDLLVNLNKSFFERLKAERYRVHPWKKPIPEEHKLTEACITAFVECCKPVAFQAMYSRILPTDACKILKHLADLRPHLIIPGIIERVCSTLDSVTEPHKMTAALQCLMFVGRALVSGHKGYTEGKTQIIPILFATLPGIDSNDFKKTSTTLQFLTSISLLIPIVDCSKAGHIYDNLTEEESVLCEQTAEFEDFVLQFMDRIFTIVDSSAVENTRMELSADEGLRSKLDSISEALIQSCCHAIMGQCSQAIKTTASRKLVDYVKTHILEPKVAGQLLGSLVRVFGRVNGKELLKSLVPYLTQQINTYIDEQSDDIAELDKQNDEFLYYLTLLTNVLRGEPDEIMNYIESDISPIIEKILKFKCKITNRTACAMITNIMANLSGLQTLDVQSSPECFSKPLQECLPIRCWGQKMKPDSKINWFVPGERSRAICEKLIHHYMPVILGNFELFAKGEMSLTREEINRDLQVVVSLLRCGNFLPNWSEAPLELVKTVVSCTSAPITLGFEGLSIQMPGSDSRNVRLAVIDTMVKVQEKLLATSEDDTNSLKTLLQVWERVHMRKHQNSLFDNQLKNYQTTKIFQEYSLTRYKRDIRAVVATRIVMQQDCRDEQSVPLFTASHRTVMLNILKLATSHYSSVRSVAQSKLNVMFSQYSFAYKTVLDDVLEYLKLDSNVHHEQFKGALYILASKKSTRLIVKHDWETVEKVWIQLLQTNLSEKPTVLRLLQLLSDAIHNEFPTLTIELQIPDRVVELALQLLPDGKKQLITAKDIEEGRLALEVRNQRNTELYAGIVNKILDILASKNLHWRYSNLAATMIYNMVHPVTKYPERVASYFVKNLIHDTLKERKIAIKILNMVLRQNKREHPKIEMDPFKIAGVERPAGDGGKLKPGMRDDNRWLQYHAAKVPRNQEEWDLPKYVYKTNGFFGWNKDFSVYAPTHQQPKLDRTIEEMTEIEKSIYNFFIDKSNVDKMMEYWALEEKKGKDKFNRTRFNMIKSLCDAFGDLFLDNLMGNLKRLIEEKSLENNHRAAAEVMGGIMKGAKHWSYEKTERMYEKMVPLINLALANVTVETDMFWGTCFATASENNDPMKQWWLHEVLLEEPLRETTSFIDCSRLYCLQGAFNQHVWRMNSVAYRLLVIVRPYLNHSFQNVRERLGSILTNIFEADLQFAGAAAPECPRIRDFIDEVMPKMTVLLTESPPVVKSGDQPMEVDGEEHKTKLEGEYETSIRLFKTISQWLIGVLNRCTNGNESAYFQLLPITCRLERSEQDAELADICSSLLAMISQALTLPPVMEIALNKINEVSTMPSWSARLAVIDVLQVLVFHNMATVLSQTQWVELVQTIVLRLMEDSVLEVREKAAEVLGGLLHCAFLPATDKLLELFKKKCRTKVIKSATKRVQMMETCSTEMIRVEGSESREATSVRVRHTGVLGLCAFISAYPYDVPDFVPDVFEHLGAHLNDPQPIPSTIRKTMGDFKRTHHDNWQTHQLKFTEDQLAVLSDLTVPPSYYA